MAGSLNRVLLIGNVGKTPEIRSLNSGDRVANFSLAMTETWKAKDSGEKKERTEWANVVVFNDGLVKVIENYVTKGSKLFVEGSMQTRKYEKDGIDRYVTEIVLTKFNGTIVLLGDKQRSDADDGPGGGTSSGEAGSRHGSRESFASDPDDPIPFITSAGMF